MSGAVSAEAKDDKPTFDMEGHVLLTPAVAAAHRLILLVWVGDRTGLADGAEAPILPVANALALGCSRRLDDVGETAPADQCENTHSKAENPEHVHVPWRAVPLIVTSRRCS